MSRKEPNISENHQLLFRLTLSLSGNTAACYESHAGNLAGKFEWFIWQLSVATWKWKHLSFYGLCYLSYQLLKNVKKYVENPIKHFISFLLWEQVRTCVFWRTIQDYIFQKSVIFQMVSGKRILFVIAVFTIAICVERKLEKGSTEKHNSEEKGTNIFLSSEKEFEFAHNSSEFV